MADDFTTHAGSVLDTLAVTRGDIPALPAGGCSLFSATGYATGGGGVPARASVPPDAKWANSIKCEIGNVVKLGTVGGVVTLVPGDNGQMADVLVGAPGIYSASGATGAISNVNTRVVIGSISSSAPNALSGVYSSQSCMAAGGASPIIGSTTSTTSGSGTSTMVIACDNTNTNGTRTAAVASDDGTINYAFRSGLFATDTCSITAASNMAALVASSNGDVDGDDSAALGTNLADVNHNYCVALGSNSPGPSAAAGSVYGGHGGTNKWILYSVTGNAYFAGNLQAAGTVVNFANLPTSSGGVPAGLASGDLWIDTSVGRVVTQVA